jgi:predicted O-linked N-acetylglucosamine transferase (SPINDLY family)
LITFGSFNNPAKLSSSTLNAWAMLMRRVPQSRLMLKGSGLEEAKTRVAYLARLQEHGFDPRRVILQGRTPRLEDHLAAYSEVDIALDSFPYNGTTTTCEALWMGVPVVTLRGDRHAARVGASILARIGLPELVADSIEAYIEVAANLASSPLTLAPYRPALREQMAKSCICDAPAFARKLEGAYQQMWSTHSARNAAARQKSAP